MISPDKEEIGRIKQSNVVDKIKIANNWDEISNQISLGAIDGILTRIGSHALPPNPSQGKGYRFPADITLNNQYLELKSGQKLPLQSGMSLNANIKLRKVTYLQLLLNKFSSKAKSIKSI